MAINDVKKKSFAEIEKGLIAILTQFLEEIDPNRSFRTITLDTYLDRDLGIDSMGRVELFHRIEKQFKIQLPESAMAEAETLQDLIKVITTQEQPIIHPSKEIHPIQQTIPMIPNDAKTLVEVLLHYQKKAPNRPHIYLQGDLGQEQIITYGQLYQRAETVARGLLELGLNHGETVAIMLPTTDSFFYAFFGVLLAGGIPVPIYPPFRPDRIAEYAIREAAILRNAEARFLITFHKAEVLSRLLRVFITSLKSVVTVDDLMSLPGKDVRIKNKAEDAGLIQYTSGSTSMPKGVMLTHHNLLSNIRAYGQAGQIQPDDVFVSWLPLYHDMGLIGAWLGSFYYGIPTVIMSPLSFLTRPSRWLWTIHYHRATISGGPNFAYELCVRKIDDEDIEGLDLSSWRLAFNGAEAVNPRTLERFADKFKKYGFKEQSLFPVYGLAENTVALTLPKVNQKPHIDKIKRAIFENELQAIPAEADSENYIEFVSCGSPLPQHAIRIVDDDGNLLAERFIGNLQFQGPSSMQGYYHNPEATRAIFHHGWWETGDLAYIADNELYITGRKKDVIIKAGRNLYPEEVEEAASEVTGIRKGCVVAFGIHDPTLGTEKLVIIAETREQRKKTTDQIVNDVIDKVTTILGIPPDHVILVPPRTIPKTSSGKLRRSSCKADYLNHKIGKPKLPTWAQLLGLFLRGGMTKLWRWINLGARVLYTAYIGLIMALLFIPLWFTIVLPSQHTARRGAKLIMNIAFILCGLPLQVKGKEHLKINTPAVYVANHASYLDAAILVAVLPPDIALVAKQELQTVKILDRFIRKLGHIYVERFDFTKSIADAHLTLQKLREGTSIALFPEGTFTYTSGIRPFRLGAFKMAVETSYPIIPVALRGTRKILRGGQFVFRPGKIKVIIEKPLFPREKTWEEMLRLRSLSRELIAKYSGEEIINV